MGGRNNMDLWYTEKWCKDVGFSVKVREHLCHVKSQYQKIDIFDSAILGKFLTLDGLMVVNEKDAFIYHEMLVHVPMAVNPEAKRALIIGGGEGGTARELLRYPGIEHIDLVEIDAQVVEACKAHLPYTKQVLEDARVNVIISDGAGFASKTPDNSYDLILVDSSFPVGPCEGLLTTSFYADCLRLLTPDGILVNQDESPYFDDTADKMKRSYAKVKKLFPVAAVYQAHIPTYPSGHWLFGMASKKYHPIKDIKAFKWHNIGLDTQYYNTDLHLGAFMLPNYVKKMLEDA